MKPKTCLLTALAVLLMLSLADSFAVLAQPPPPVLTCRWEWGCSWDPVNHVATQEDPDCCCKLPKTDPPIFDCL